MKIKIKVKSKNDLHSLRVRIIKESKEKFAGLILPKNTVLALEKV